MNTEEATLWEKISMFNLDDESSSFKFSARLARENGWTLKYSKAVIHEYKKFLFLCCVHKTGVTPSDQVDQVWHLHLTYTKSYWTDLCRNTLGREIHHNPTKGGEKERVKFNDFYTETLNLYREKFSMEPPINIWPRNEARFSAVHFQRMNRSDYWLIRKPSFQNSRMIILILVILSLFFIQSHRNGGREETIFGFIVVIAFAISSIVKKKGGGSDNSSSGCGGDGGCSGCGDGCGGCGGD